MGILDRLLGIFRKKAPIQAIQSLESINQSLNQSEESSSIELQRESLQLGLAAGYAGRSLREIESSLVRIESQMVSKEWLVANFSDQKRVLEILESIRDILKVHDELTMKHFEMIETSLLSLQGIARKAPEPIRTQMLTQINLIESQLPLTPRMRQLEEIVKEAGEISYTDLANRLGITESALRGFLTQCIRRGVKVQRLEKGGKGWVKFIPISA
ncbi:MAG: FeoC-like transcriptional regulator [Candidatus Aenigmatarchaeota archaeon]